MTPRAALSRRTALATAAVVPVALSGCDIDPPADEGPHSEVAPTPHQDAALVASLVTAIAEAEAVLTAAGEAAPALAPQLAGLASAHAAHRELLAEAAPDAGAQDEPAVGVPSGRADALAAVRRMERLLRGEVERGCLQASSGDLARLLAVVAGSLAQHAAALDAVAARRRTL